jgi:hypothetical protein
MKIGFYFPLIAWMLLSVPVQAQKTIHLFDGNDLKGWYAYQPEAGKHSDAAELFSVKDHMIRLYGKNAGYLMSNQSFHNFRLTVQFRWNADTTFVRKNNHINSGVMYLVPKDTPDQLWPEGVQFQIKQSHTGDFIFLHGVTARIQGQPIKAGKSVVTPRFKDAAKPFGQWNTFVVTVKNGHITQRLNGELVNEGSDVSVAKGRVMLMYEGYPIDFRKVDIQRL